MRTIVLILLAWCSTMTARATEVVVTPEQSTEVLANPGMGWETFAKTSKEDTNLPDWIPSTVEYMRWGWGTLEPRAGEIDFALVDRTLREARGAGQKLAFRVMCSSPEPGQAHQPAWLRRVGGRELRCDYQGRGAWLVPDLDDPIVLERHLSLVKRLGERYDGHADLDHVDLGSVGWWGEWHISDSAACRMPTLENRKKIIDAYLSAFRRTPLLMPLNDTECARYATQRGTGWRADCLGDLGGFSKEWSHMRVGYPMWIRQAGIEDVWKHAPVAWETCWDMRKWVAEGWSLRSIFNYALALHASYLNNKSAPLPPGERVRAEVQRFLRRLGYRLVLKELRHSAQVNPGGVLALTMQWQNSGSAPCYRPYRLAYRLRGEHGYEKVFVGKVTVDRWLPGSMELFTREFLDSPGDLPPGEVAKISDMMKLPDDLPPGVYELAIAVVGEQTTEPVVRLGIHGRAKDGWYPLSKLELLPSGRDR